MPPESRRQYAQSALVLAKTPQELKGDPLQGLDAGL